MTLEQKLAKAGITPAQHEATVASIMARVNAMPPAEQAAMREVLMGSIEVDDIRVRAMAAK